MNRQASILRVWTTLFAHNVDHHQSVASNDISRASKLLVSWAISRCHTDRLDATLLTSECIRVHGISYRSIHKWGQPFIMITLNETAAFGGFPACMDAVHPYTHFLACVGSFPILLSCRSTTSLLTFWISPLCCRQETCQACTPQATSAMAKELENHEHQLIKCYNPYKILQKPYKTTRIIVYSSLP